MIALIDDRYYEARCERSRGGRIGGRARASCNKSKEGVYVREGEHWRLHDLIGSE